MVADVTVVGVGVIGLAAALELADRGLDVRLVGTTHAGDASSASGGMLAPSVEPELGPAGDFAIASRDMWPEYSAGLAERSKRSVPLNTRGIIELACDEGEAAELRQRSNQRSSWLDERSLYDLDSQVSGLGALFHPGDGSADPLPLLDALRAAVAGSDRIATASEDVCSMHIGDSACNAYTDRESRFSSDYVVLAAGAWSGLIEGAGEAARAVEPVMGQMAAFDSSSLRHVVYGAGGYLVPKADGHVVVGSTMQHTGFESDTDPATIEMLSARAARICPSLAGRSPVSTWAGLRPMTPDGLPLLGKDPERPRLVLACGHSRNGILLTPITARVVADFVTGVTPAYDMLPFRPDRLFR